MRLWASTKLAILVGAVVVLGAAALAVYLVRTDRAAQTVHYRGRDYIEPATISGAEAATWRPLDSGHTRRRWLPLMIPHSEVADGEVPTVILLQRGDGRDDIDALSGGP